MADIPIKLKTSFDGRAANQGIRNLNTKLGGLQKTAIAAFGAFITTKAVQGLGELSDATIKFEQSLVALSAQMEGTGRSADGLLSSLQEITKGQISMAELVIISNRAIAALGEQAIPKLGELADVAARMSSVVGVSTVEALERLTGAIAKQEKELLDELGIIFNATQVYKEYGDAIGVTGDELTAAQKQQAFMNETLEQAQEKFGDLAIQVNPMQQLSAAVKDLGAAFGSLLLDVGAEQGIEGLATAIRGMADALSDPGTLKAIKDIAIALGVIAASAGAPKIMDLLSRSFGALAIAGALLIDKLKAIQVAFAAAVRVVMVVVAAMLELGVALSFLAGMLSAFGTAVIAVILVIKNFGGVLRVAATAITTVWQALGLLVDAITALINLIPGLNIAFGWMGDALEFLDNAIAKVIQGLEFLFKTIDLVIGQIRGLIGNTDAATDSINRFEDAIDRMSGPLSDAEKTALATAGAADALTESVAGTQAGMDSFSTGSAQGQLDGLIGKFLDLTITARESIRTMLIAQGLTTFGPPTGRHDPTSFLQPRGTVPTPFGQDVIGEFGMEAILEQLVGAGAAADRERLRGMLGLGDRGAGGAAGGAGGASQAVETVVSIMEDFGRAMSQNIAQIEAATLIGEDSRDLQERQADIYRSTLETLILFRDGLEAIGADTADVDAAINLMVAGFMEVAGSATNLANAVSSAAAQLQGIISEVTGGSSLKPTPEGGGLFSQGARIQTVGGGLANAMDTAARSVVKDVSDAADKTEEAVEEVESVFDNFLSGLGSTLGNFLNQWGWKGGEFDLAGLIKPIAGQIGTFATEALGMGGGFFGGLLPGLISGGIGAIVNRLVGEEPLEIEQPIDIKIIDIETHLMDFFNFRGLDPFTYSSSFRTVFENGLY